MQMKIGNHLMNSIDIINPHKSMIYGDFNIVDSLNYLAKAVAISTATATVQPTIGLLPIPKNPIIST
ncbi:hypothetical protein SAMN05444405_10298 [Bacteroides luti]|uniref:Uncharacterized protein n=1 Tax=Bacteroides luti TaxID=1297750 RepID=A0A1M4UIU4_9BACE|nr:hypothetical protein SAMN05444405_10298 [Bacteroides luti]